MEAIAFPTSAPPGETRRGLGIGVGSGTGRRIGGTLDGVRRLHPVPGVTTTAGSAARLHQLFEARFALERAAVMRPVASGVPHDPAIIGDLHDQWRELAADDDATLLVAFAEADDDFHLRLATAARDPELTLALADLHARLRAARPVGAPSPARMRQAVGDHLAVLAAVVDADLECASRLLDRHLVRSMTAAEQQVACDLARRIVSGPRLS